MDLLCMYASDDDADCDKISPTPCGSEESLFAYVRGPCHENDQYFNTNSSPQHIQQSLQLVHSTITYSDSNIRDTSNVDSPRIKQSTAICNLPTILQLQNTATTGETLTDSSAQSSAKENSLGCAKNSASLCYDPPTSITSSVDKFTAAHGSSAVDFFNLCADSDDDSSEDRAILPGGSSNLKTSDARACSEKISAIFWNTTSPLCNWGQCEQIWGVPREEVESSSPVSAIESSAADNQWKRRKLIKDSEQIDYSSTASVKLKPCFMLHHKIAPYLQDARLKKTVCRCPKKLMLVLPGHAGTVNRINWCVEEYSHLLLSASMDATVRIWNVFSSSSVSCVRTLRCHTKAVKDAVWIETGKQIISCGFDKTARISDVEHGSEISVCLHQDFVGCVKSYPVDNNLFVTGLSDRLIGWDRRSPSKPIRIFKYKDKIGQVHDICFLRSGTQFLTCADLVSRDSADRNIMVWDFGSGAVLSNQIFHERYTCTRLCVHPTRDVFLAQTQGNYIAEFSATYPYRINKCKRYEGHKVAGYSVGCDVSPDGAMVVSGSADGQLSVYDYSSARTLYKLPTSQTNDIILDVAWNPVLFSTVAAATWSGDIVLWQ